MENHTKNLKVTALQYFDTARGVGYVARTNVHHLYIANAGVGGPTEIFSENKETPPNMTEFQLEDLISAYEGITTKLRNV
jgi:hypothetical protein